MRTPQSADKHRMLCFRLAVLALVFSINLFFGLAFAGDVQYDTELKRDPMVPVMLPGPSASSDVTKESAVLPITVQGIVMDPAQGALALIDGDVKKVGDSVGEAVIVEILKDRVLLTQNDEEKVVWLREEIATSDSVSP